MLYIPYSLDSYALGTYVLGSTNPNLKKFVGFWTATIEITFSVSVAH